MKDLQFFKHNDGTVIVGFDNAISYFENNYFDDSFEEITEEEYNDVLSEDSEICECGHHTNDHSYSYPSALDNNLYCDKCDCKNFVPHAISEPEVKDGS